jgi:prevent-host-death family protein
MTIAQEPLLLETFGAFDAKTHFSALLERVADGEEILITRRGKAVARLVPAAPPAGEPVADPVAELPSLRAGCTLGGLDWRELRDEGRQ